MKIPFQRFGHRFGHPLECICVKVDALGWTPRFAVFFLVLCACLTYGEIRFPASIPLKSTDVSTVPLFNIWTIGWNANRALHGFQGYWDAPIFFPAEKAFAFSEPQPATLSVAPVVWVTGSAVAGYKAWLFLSLFSNGFFAALLLRRLGYGWFHQLVGGIAITLLPVIHHRIDVVQLVPVWGILWFWSSIFELVKRPGTRTAIETGLSFAVCFALCVHHALFLSLLIPFAGLVFVPLLAKRRFLSATLTAMVVGALVVLPIVLPIRAAAVTNGFSRKKALVKRMSAKPVYYLASQPNSLIKFDRFEGPKSRQFCTGWFRMTLAVIGIGYGLLLGTRRRWVLFLLLIGVFAFMFSLGLDLEVRGWRPWETLCELPGVGQVRSVFRFAWFVQLAIVLLAVEGLAALHAIRQRWFAVSWSKTALACFVLIPGALVAGEIWPEPARRGGVPEVKRHTEWIQFVRDHATAGRSIACLPFAAGTSVRHYDMTTRWMCYGLKHGVPMVNGYSGFFPRKHLDLQKLVTAEFPSARVLNEFAKFDVEYLVVVRKYCEPNVMLGLSTDAIGLELVFVDPVGIDVYRLRSPGRTNTQ